MDEFIPSRYDQYALNSLVSLVTLFGETRLNDVSNPLPRSHPFTVGVFTENTTNVCDLV